MVSGHLSSKKDYWYIVLELKDADGKRKPKWIATHLPCKGNKRRAMEMLYEERMKYSKDQGVTSELFSEYLLRWVESCKVRVAIGTYAGYKSCIERSIAPYFQEKGILLSRLKPADIQKYYDTLYEKGLSGNSVLHHHVIIRKALEDAFVRDLIISNPADKVTRPKKEQYVADCYSVDECNRLLECIQGDPLELTILLTLFYGLRRSEVLGLKWSAIDFDKNVISINHSVSFAEVDGHYQVIPKDKLKRNSSFRTLPLVDSLAHRLRVEFEERFKDCEPDYDAYICVDKKGNLFKPNYLSQHFQLILNKHNLRKIRFHDLRHSCANLLITARVPLIEVQQWLGHSSISTTADLYSHLEFASKEKNAETMKKF